MSQEKSKNFNNSKQLTRFERFKFHIYKIIKFVLALPLFLILVLLGIDVITTFLVKDRIYTNIKSLPQREYALVLGTAKFYAKDSINRFYQYRLDAVKELVSAHKVDAILVSGDNKTPYYNEPKTMTRDLLKMGISPLTLKQDYAGYTTFDSILRAKHVYHLPPFTIVSQKFHCERALLIAKYHQIDAICYVAKYPDGAYKVRIREMLARAGMVFYLLTNKIPETLEDLPSK